MPFLRILKWLYDFITVIMNICSNIMIKFITGIGQGLAFHLKQYSKIRILLASLN